VDAWRNEDELQQASLIDWRWRLRASRPHIPRWLMALRSQRLSEPPEPSAAPAAAQAHDAPSFELFYQRHAGAIFGYLWRVCGDEQTANDLTQDVFFSAWRHFEKLRGYDRPEAWLFRVATNLALNERRHQRVAGPAASLHGYERAAGDHAAQFAERSALRGALEGLPAQQRAAFILREVYGHSCAEVAELLGVSRAAAKMTLSRARASLRRLYLHEEAAE
jgi:RNA polymerase sigma-70 factor (ECF subfamily)